MIFSSAQDSCSKATVAQAPSPAAMASVRVDLPKLFFWRESVSTNLKQGACFCCAA